MLSVAVKGGWKACPLAASAFVDAQPIMATLELMPKAVEVRLPETVSVGSACIDLPAQGRRRRMRDDAMAATA